MKNVDGEYYFSYYLIRDHLGFIIGWTLRDIQNGFSERMTKFEPEVMFLDISEVENLELGILGLSIY